MKRNLPGAGVRIVTFAILSFCLQAGVGHDNGESAPPPVFSVHDTDGDGYLSQQEYEVFYSNFRKRHQQAGRPANRMLRILAFEQIDDNGDGRVSSHEMVMALQQRRKGPGWRWRQPAF